MSTSPTFVFELFLFRFLVMMAINARMIIVAVKAVMVSRRCNSSTIVSSKVFSEGFGGGTEGVQVIF